MRSFLLYVLAIIVVTFLVAFFFGLRDYILPKRVTISEGSIGLLVIGESKEHTIDAIRISGWSIVAYGSHWVRGSELMSEETAAFLASDEWGVSRFDPNPCKRPTTPTTTLRFRNNVLLSVHIVCWP